MEIDYYVNLNGRCPVNDFIIKLQARDRIKVIDYINKLEEHGTNLDPPISKPLGDHINELRPRNHRILYCIFIEIDTAVLLHAITKKAGPVPEIDKRIAKIRRNEYIERFLEKDKG